MGLKSRKWFKDNWAIVLREIAYHKEHREIESTPYKVVKKEEQ